MLRGGLLPMSHKEQVRDWYAQAAVALLLSAQRVAPGGKAYGLDMTDETRTGRWRRPFGY